MPNMLMLFAAMGSKTLQTVTFNSNTTWVAPTGVNLLTTLVGHGAAGTAAFDDTSYFYDTRTDAFHNNGNPGDTTFLISSSTSRTAMGGDPTVPADFCNDPFPNGPPPGYSQICYTFTGGSTGSFHPATTGASATGFGFTFAGGTGGAATTDTHNNVTVTPGASYTIVVPSGATIQITFYQ